MSVRIGLGLAGFPFEDAAAFRRWIDFCEDSAVDSVWFSERLVSSQAILEPLSACALVAGRTQRLKFGMNAVVLPLRDPLLLAKECATIDYVSGGRLLPVFGVGNDTAPEWRATGRSPANRGARANECLELVARLWSEENVTFEGKHYAYRDVTISPRPAQSPLPLWIGGSSEAAIERTARYGTGWLGGSGQTPEQAGATVASIAARLAKYGRGIEADHYGVGLSYRFGSWDEPVVQQQASALLARLGSDAEPSSLMAVGGADEVIALVDRFIEAGLSKFVLRPVASSGEEMLAQSRRLAAEVLPVIHSRQTKAAGAGLKAPH
jgi:probable F420-dependent oxidoreductase